MGGRDDRRLRRNLGLRSDRADMLCRRLQLGGRGAGPGEEALVGAEADPDAVTIPLNAIVALFVEIDRDPDNVGAELGVPNVGDAGSVDSVVGGTRGRQRRAEDVDHQTVRLAEDEVLDLHGPANVDHDLRTTRSRDHAYGSHLAGWRRSRTAGRRSD